MSIPLPLTTTVRPVADCVRPVPLNRASAAPPLTVRVAWVPSASVNWITCASDPWPMFTSSAPTVTVNTSCVVAPAKSVAVTVMVEVPTCPGA